MWIIIKNIPNEKGVKMPVIILNEHHEVWEFDTKEKAEFMRRIFEQNSDSGYEYLIKEI